MAMRRRTAPSVWPRRGGSAGPRAGPLVVSGARGLVEPVAEAGLAEAGVVAGDDAALAEDGAEVAGTGIGDDRPGVVTRGEDPADEVVEPELLGPGDLDDAVEGLAHGDAADCGGDVVGRDRLEQHRWQA